MNPAELEFLDFVDDWLEGLSGVPKEDGFGQAERTSILSVDMTNAFCREGALASPRVADIIPAVTELMRMGWAAGVRDFALLQDCHRPDALEFEAFAPHALCGSPQAEAVEEIKALPFYELMSILEKNSVSADQNSELPEWLSARPQLDTFIVVGDCTDICVYMLAMFLRARANACHLPWRVIVPEDCVATYDLTVEAAQKLGALPHAGDLLHKVFLYHLALNGVEVIKSIK